MKSLILLGLLLTGSSFAENLDCTINVCVSGQCTPKTGTIDITEDQATHKNWGAQDRTIGPLNVLREVSGRIRIDYFNTGEKFKNATNFNLGIVLTPPLPADGTFKYDLTLIDPIRSDSCILR